MAAEISPNQMETPCSIRSIIELIIQMHENDIKNGKLFIISVLRMQIHDVTGVSIKDIEEQLPFVKDIEIGKNLTRVFGKGARIKSYHPAWMVIKKLSLSPDDFTIYSYIENDCDKKLDTGDHFIIGPPKPTELLIKNMQEYAIECLEEDDE